MDKDQLQAYRDLLRMQEAEAYKAFEMLLSRETFRPCYRPKYTPQGTLEMRHHWGKG